MIVPYLSDVAIYCEQAVFLFSFDSGSSREIRPSCSLLTSACVHLVWRIHSATIEGAVRFWTPTGVKRRCSCGCVRLWNLKSFSVSEGSTDKTGKLSSLCLSFVFQLKSKAAAHFICPQSACSCFGGGLQRCEPWAFSARCCKLFHWKAFVLQIQEKKKNRNRNEHMLQTGLHLYRSSGIKYLLRIY